MATIRELLSYIADYIDLSYKLYTATSIDLPLEGNGEYHYSSLFEDDIRNEITIGIGHGLSVVKNNHLRIVHCVIPREFVTPEIKVYRDPRDLAMYKFWLPERTFNSILRSHPVDIEKMIETAKTKFENRSIWDD